MNFYIKVSSIVTLFFFIMIVGGLVSAATPIPNSYGAKGALQDSKITLEEALTYAIQDEYLAQSRYDRIIDKFGSVRTFVQIRGAELRHIDALKGLFQKYNVSIPKNDANQYTDAPEALKDAYKEGVTGEIDNIKMYKKLSRIPNLQQDLKNVFMDLENASKNHLAAFERGVGRSQ